MPVEIALPCAGLAAYLLGSVPYGLLLARAKGVDLRKIGSGNIGATNVARALGKPWALLVLFLDAAKAAVIPLLLTLFFVDDHNYPLLFAISGAAGVLGHCFPVWLKFRGGKGVATALGLFAVADPATLGLCVAAFVVIYGAFRIVSIASISATVLAPLLLFGLGRPTWMIFLAIFCAAIIVFRHKDNIVRLVSGSENKVKPQPR